MNGKVASLLLMCLVALSIVYGCGSIALSSHANQSMNAVPSGPTTVTGGPCQNVKVSYSELNLDILGDPVEDIKPH